MPNNTMTPTRPPESYWLIVKGEAGRTRVLTVDPNGLEEALAVFGFEEEARIFLLGGSGAGWRLRETTAGELISVLYGPCAGVGFVALDPLPEIVSRGMIGLVSLSRERFVDRLIERAEPLVSRAGEGTFIEEETGLEKKPADHAGLRSGQTGCRVRSPAARVALS